MLICGLGCTPRNPEIRVVGNVPSDELPAIMETVNRQLLERYGSTENRPITSVEVSTNNSYRIDQVLLRILEARTKTNASSEKRLQEVRERIESRRADATNIAIEVWYADKYAQWNQAGYVVEKQSTGWKVVSELYR
jgi:hypothetical protein